MPILYSFTCTGGRRESVICCHLANKDCFNGLENSYRYMDTMPREPVKLQEMKCVSMVQVKSH